MKLQMHRKFCSKPPRVFDEIRVPKKACTISKQQLNPPMVKPFWLTYLAKGNHPLLEILTTACLTFCLLLTDRPTLDLPEYKLKVANICKMHWRGSLEVVVLYAF